MHHEREDKSGYPLGVGGQDLTYIQKLFLLQMYMML